MPSSSRGSTPIETLLKTSFTTTDRLLDRYFTHLSPLLPSTPSLNAFETGLSSSLSAFFFSVTEQSHCQIEDDALSAHHASPAMTTTTHPAPPTNARNMAARALLLQPVSRQHAEQQGRAPFAPSSAGVKRVGTSLASSAARIVILAKALLVGVITELETCGAALYDCGREMEALKAKRMVEQVRAWLEEVGDAVEMAEADERGLVAAVDGLRLYGPRVLYS